MGARTFVTPVAFTHAATRSRASRIGRLENESRQILAKWTICSPDPLATSRMTPVVGRTSRRTSRMKSRLRSVAGANWRSSLIFLTDSGDSGRRIAYGARVVANGYREPVRIIVTARGASHRSLARVLPLPFSPSARAGTCKRVTPRERALPLRAISPLPRGT
jgi:hypothetical protein